MSNLQAALVVIIPFSIATFFIWRWIFSGGLDSVGSEEEMKEKNRRFRDRQLNPDFEAFKNKFGVDVPEHLKNIYRKTELFDEDAYSLMSNVIDFKGNEQSLYFAWIERMDEEYLNQPMWPGTENYFSFANDGSGDQYLLDPKLEDSEIYYYEHETSKKIGTGVKLSQVEASIKVDETEY